MKLTDGLRITGKIKIDTYRAGMVDAVTPYLDQRRFYRALPDTRAEVAAIDEIIQDIKAAHHIRRAVECSNLVMDSPNYGLDIIIQRLAGINTYSLNLLWIELGTGTTAPTVNDTGLTTPSIRAAVSLQEDYGATDAIVQAYIIDANLPNATYGEVGSFVDGTSSIGSGQLFNHALISPTYTKVSGEDTTIEVDINLTNS